MAEVIKIRTEHEDKASKSLNNLKSVLKATFSVYAVTQIANMSIKLTVLASAAEEVKNKFDVVFKGADKATDSMKKLSERTGYAVSSLQKMASNLGDLIKPAGFASDKAFELSERIVKLSLDIASFSNTHPDQVVMDFQSALAGSSETLQKYGIDAREGTLAQKAMNMGLIDSIKSYQKLDPEMKRQVRTLALIEKAYDDSRDAIGDLDRTSDSYANQTRVLQESIKMLGETVGQIVIGPMTSFVSILNQSVIAIRDTIDATRDKIAWDIIMSTTGVKCFKDVLIEMLKGKTAAEAAAIAMANQMDAIVAYMEKLDELADKTKDRIDIQEDENKAIKQNIDLLGELKLAKDLQVKGGIRIGEKEQKESYEKSFDEFTAYQEAMLQYQINNNQARYDDLANFYNRQLELLESKGEKYTIEYIRTLERRDDATRKSVEMNQKYFKAQSENYKFMTSQVVEAFSLFKEESRIAFEAFKAFQIAETMIATFASAQKAFDAMASIPWVGPFLGTAAAASAIAMGLARVAAISQQTYEPRAQGGVVQAGMHYMVGEQGREMFVPDLSGYIIPNRMMKNLGTVHHHYHINAMDVQSFRDFLRRGGASVLESEVSKGRLF